MPKKTIRFIVNPVSGGSSKKPIIKAIDELIDREKYDCAVWPTLYAGHGAVLAAMAAENGVDVVVAIGGDGTINEVARSLVHTQTVLGIVPCGSGNGLARHLQIPLDYRKALRMINEGNSVNIDYGLINERPFFCTCGMGYDAEVSYKFSASSKRGLLTYMENTIAGLAKYEPEAYTIIDEQGRRTYKALCIAVANASQYGNNAYIAPYASMADGLMDVTVIEPFPVAEAPAMAYRLFTGKFEDGARHIRMLRTDRLRIVREREGVIHCDGDPMKASREIEVCIVPAGLRVICESDADAHTQPLYQTIGQQVASLTLPAAATFRQASQVILDLFKKR